MADKTDEPFFKVTVGEKVYELQKLTLIDSVFLKKKFGMKTLDGLDPTDPETLLGYLFLCVRREKPESSEKEVMAEVEQIDMMEILKAFFEDDEDEAEDVEPDPTPDTPPSSKPPARAKAKPKTAGV